VVKLFDSVPDEQQRWWLPEAEWCCVVANVMSSDVWSSV